MKRTITFLFLFFFSFLFSFQNIMAQDRGELRKRRQEREVRETIKVYMYYKMKTALDLTDEQEAAIIPKVEEMEMQKHKHREEKRNFLKELEEMLRDEKTSDQALEDEIERFRKMEQRHQDNQKEILSEIDTLLNPRQKAKFLIFMVNFREDIKHKIEHIRRMQEQEEMRRKAQKWRQQMRKNSDVPENFDDEF